jgi:hypothetical protein
MSDWQNLLRKAMAQRGFYASDDDGDDDNDMMTTIFKVVSIESNGRDVCMKKKMFHGVLKMFCHKHHHHYLRHISPF